MPLAQYPELQKLTKNQKQMLADELWISAVDDSKMLRAEEQRLVDSRWDDYLAGKTKRISLAELENRVSRR
jgi:hypothetical protein